MSPHAAEPAREIALAAIRAVNPRELTAAALRDWSAASEAASVDVIAIGKAAAAMANGVADAVGSALRTGVAIVPESAALPSRVAQFIGGHPMPNAEGARGAEAIAKLLGERRAGSRILVLISGGASALATLPADGVTLDDVIATSRALMDSGADIRELNCVRKHLDRLKGGQMARISAGASIRALVLSDVIGDPLDVIASGPLAPDPTTFGDAIEVMHRRGAWDSAPARVRDRLLAGMRGAIVETPKAGDPCFANVAVEIIGNNALAVQGAAAEARRRGFTVEVVDEPIDGEARDAGAAFARHVLDVRERAGSDGPLCVVAGGESTVRVTGNGIGGRNLEFAAGAALALDGRDDIAIASLGTDGRDGPTDAAGAIVDGQTVLRLRDAGVDLSTFLMNNDSLRALDACGAVIRTGITGTNVMDVHVGIVVG